MTKKPFKVKAVFLATFRLKEDHTLPDPLNGGDDYFYEDIVDWPDSETMVFKIMARNLAIWSIRIPTCAMDEVVRKQLKKLKLQDKERALELDDTGIFNPRSRLLSVEIQFAKETIVRGKISLDIVNRFTWCPCPGEDEKWDGIFNGQDTFEGSKIHRDKEIEWEDPMSTEQVDQIVESILEKSGLFIWFKKEHSNDAREPGES